MRLTDTLDQFMYRLLWLSPPAEVSQPAPSEGEEITTEQSKPAERAFGWSLFISAIRCTLQYVLLPIILPLIGLVGSFSLVLVIGLDLLALFLLVTSLRYFWRMRHPRRWDMLPLSATILVLIFGSLAFDLWRAFG